MKTTEFIPLCKAIRLEHAIAWLSNYKTAKDVNHKIADSIDTIDIEATKLLNELGELNNRRAEIIAELKAKNDIHI